MVQALKNLEPKKVFYFFEKLSCIPRGSGNEQAVSDYLVNFANERGFQVEQDTNHNVVMHVPASTGCENAPIVMLQNHMDMVCEKFPEIDLDFKTDGLQLAIDHEKNVVYAKGTSLGADNGIGLAVALAIADDKEIIHPPLEIVCTVGEEIGLVGAATLDMSKLKAKFMINSDSYKFDMVQAGCAGCAYFITDHIAEWTETSDGDLGAELVVGGLIGGHSGLDMMKQRTNANKLMARFLDMLVYHQIAFRIADYSCINKDNAIPRDAICRIVLLPGQKDIVERIVVNFLNDVKNELQITDPDVDCKLNWIETPPRSLSEQDTNRMIHYMMLAPDGMFQKFYLYEDPDLAESSCNMGRIFIKGDTVTYRHMVRANFASRKLETLRKLQILSDSLGMTSHVEHSAPQWDLDFKSPLLALVKKCYHEMTGGEIEVSVAHGTCECGFFKTGVGCDTVSIGPDIRNLHSPTEEVDIASVKKLYELNLRILEELAKM